MWDLKLTCHQYLHHHHPINSSIRVTWDLKLTCHQHRHRHHRSCVRRRRHIPIASITNTIATWSHVRCKTHESPASIIRMSFMICARSLVDSIWFNNTARFHQMLGNGWVLHCRVGEGFYTHVYEDLGTLYTPWGLRLGGFGLALSHS